MLIYLKDLKASDVQDSYEVLAGQRGVEGPVDPTHQPLEHAVVRGFGQCANRVVHLHKGKSGISWGLDSSVCQSALESTKRTISFYCFHF